MTMRPIYKTLFVALTVLSLLASQFLAAGDSMANCLDLPMSQTDMAHHSMDMQAGHEGPNDQNMCDMDCGSMCLTSCGIFLLADSGIHNQPYRAVPVPTASFSNIEFINDFLTPPPRA